MKTIFKQLKFNREQESLDTVVKTRFEFFVPGVNSGIYSPASLHVTARIEEQKAGFFKLKKTISYSSFTLNASEFDELFEEMKKIKVLRDAKL